MKHLNFVQDSILKAGDLTRSYFNCRRFTVPARQQPKEVEKVFKSNLWNAFVLTARKIQTDADFKITELKSGSYKTFLVCDGVGVIANIHSFSSDELLTSPIPMIVSENELHTLYKDFWMKLKVSGDWMSELMHSTNTSLLVLDFMEWCSLVCFYLYCNGVKDFQSKSHHFGWIENFADINSDTSLTKMVKINNWFKVHLPVVLTSTKTTTEKEFMNISNAIHSKVVGYLFQF